MFNTDKMQIMIICWHGVSGRDQHVHWSWEVQGADAEDKLMKLNPCRLFPSVDPTAEYFASKDATYGLQLRYKVQGLAVNRTQKDIKAARSVHVTDNSHYCICYLRTYLTRLSSLHFVLSRCNSSYCVIMLNIL